MVLNDVLSRLWRLFWMLVAGALVLTVAGVLLLFTLAFVAVVWLRALLTGQPFGWRGWQETTASKVWRQYQRRYTATDGGASATTTEVVDVEFREVSPHAGSADAATDVEPRRLGVADQDRPSA
jgi:hypothetical protein